MNFGLVPYGHSIYGTVYKAQPFDACNDLAPVKWTKNQGTLILLAERGNCNFSQKVIHAQNVGAGLVIIGDTNTNYDIHKIFPVERTKEMLDKVLVPSILLSQTDFELFQKTIDHLENNRELKNETNDLQLAVFFDLVKSKQKADIKIILQVDDYRSYDLLLDFYKFFSPFKNDLNIQIHYKIFMNQDFQFQQDDCIKIDKENFCVSKSFGNNKKNLNLAQITINQLCLKQFDLLILLEYMRQIRAQCFEKTKQVTDNFFDCNQKVFEYLTGKKNYQNLKTCMQIGSKENISVLKNNQDDIKYYIINYSPLIFINGHYYKGNYDNISRLFEAICSSYEVPPKSCHLLDSFKTAKELSAMGIGRFIVYSIFVCASIVFLSMVLFYILYKKQMKKRFNFILNDKINEALAKYYSENDDMVQADRKEEMQNKAVDEAQEELKENLEDQNQQKENSN